MQLWRIILLSWDFLKLLLRINPRSSFVAKKNSCRDSLFATGDWKRDRRPTLRLTVRFSIPIISVTAVEKYINNCVIICSNILVVVRVYKLLLPYSDEIFSCTANSGWIRIGYIGYSPLLDTRTVRTMTAISIFHFIFFLVQNFTWSNPFSFSCPRVG